MHCLLIEEQIIVININDLVYLSNLKTDFKIPDLITLDEITEQKFSP